MSGKKQVEARLERSLRNQVVLPKLGKAFDAAVWARIEAEERATNPGVGSSRAVRASRWFAIINTVGIAVTLVAIYFALGSFGGVEPPVLDLGVHVPMPEISEATVTKSLAMLGQVLGLAALLFGLSFTSPGRRLRASFS